MRPVDSQGLSDLRSMDELMAAAADATAQGRRQEAIDLYRRGLDQERRNAVLRNNLGCLLLETGSLAEAVAVLDDPSVREGLPEHQRNLAYGLLRSGDHERAESILREILRKSPRDADARNHLGLALVGRRQDADALSEFTRVIREEPAHLEGWNNLGCAFERSGDFESAESAFREALRVDPYSVDAHNNVGCVLREMGRVEEGIEALTVAVQLEPENASIHLNLALSYHREGLPQKALSHLHRYLRQQPPGSSVPSHVHELIHELESNSGGDASD